MARPRSEEKRIALLDAAARAVAEEGVGATTARVSRLAGVAEGTLFTYFDNKDALLNALYLHLKTGLREAMMGRFPHGAAVQVQAQAAWDGYIAWGLAHPAGHRALQQLVVSDRIDAAHRAAGSEGFSELHDVLLGLFGTVGSLPAEAGLAFAGALFNAMAQAVMDSIVANPGGAEAYRDRGFKAFWAALNTGQP